MGKIYRTVAFWQCVPCRFEWIARDEEKPPVLCPSCKSPDWYLGKRTGKTIKATVVRPVGKKLKVLQQAPRAALRLVKDVERAIKAEVKGGS